MENMNSNLTSRKYTPFTKISAVSISLVVFSIMAMSGPSAQAQDKEWISHKPDVNYKEKEKSMSELKVEITKIEKQLAFEEKIFILWQQKLADLTMQNKELTDSEKDFVKMLIRGLKERHSYIKQYKNFLEEKKEKIKHLEKQEAAKNIDRKKYSDSAVDELAPYELKAPEAKKIDKKNPANPGKDSVIDAGGNGMLIGKRVRLQDLEGCGTTITGFKRDEEFGQVETPCPALTGGLLVTQKDYLTVCKKYEGPRDAGKMQAYPHPTGLLPVCSTDARSVPFRTGAGLRGTPMTALCNKTHYGLLANRDAEIYNAAVKKGGLNVVFKYSKKTRKLECFFLSREQSDSINKKIIQTQKALSPKIGNTEASRE